MYRVRSRGMGRTVAEDAVCKASFAGGFFSPTCWSALTPSTLAPPGAPTGDTLTVPPASAADAQATVDALVNQQLVDQQALNAGAVQSTWWDTLTGNTAAAGSGVSNLLSTAFPWILAGLGVFAMVAMGGGSARRYGR